MDLRYPPPGAPRDVGKAKRIAGLVAAASGFVVGFGVLVFLKLPPLLAAFIAALDFTIGMGLYMSGRRQQKREEAAKRAV